MPSIIVTDSSGTTHRHRIPEAEGTCYSLGRSPECDISLPEEGHLSRTHCLLIVHENRLILEDNHSSNGTFEQHRRVTRETMHPGIIYTLGKCTLTLLPAASPSSAPPRPLQQNEPGQKTPPATKSPRQNRVHLRRRPAPDQLKEQREPGTSGAELGLPVDFGLELRLLNTAAVLHPGSKLRFSLKSERDCYLYLVQYDCENVPTLLVPGVEDEDNRLFAGRELQFPRAAGNEYELIVEPPVGQEIVLALACTTPCRFEQAWYKQLSRLNTPSPPGETESRIVRMFSNRKRHWSSSVLRFCTAEK